MYNSAFKPDFFAGQTVVITGGGSGIGRCTAHELASLGANVVLIGRNADKLAKVQAELKEDGYAGDYYSLDIRNGEEVAKTVATILAKHGRIDGLVNNAGGQYPSPLRDITDKGWDAVIRNNLNGGFSMMREVYTQCMETHGGAIVNIAAVVAFGMPKMGHTGAARAGMINLTQTAALEWASAGVRVNCVLPGSIASSGMAIPAAPERAQARHTAQAPGTGRRSLGGQGQAGRQRNRRARQRTGDPHLRRRGHHARIPRRPHPPRRAGVCDRRRHQRNPAQDHRAELES